MRNSTPGPGCIAELASRAAFIAFGVALFKGSWLWAGATLAVFVVIFGRWVFPWRLGVRKRQSSN